MEGLLILVVMFGLMWVLFVLPQQKRVRAQQALIETLRPGEDVMTSAGVFGVVRRVDADVVRLEVAPGVEIRVAKGAIASRGTAPPKAPERGRRSRPAAANTADADTGGPSPATETKGTEAKSDTTPAANTVPGPGPGGRFGTGEAAPASEPGSTKDATAGDSPASPPA